jgi:hypothetical protein
MYRCFKKRIGTKEPSSLSGKWIFSIQGGFGKEYTRSTFAWSLFEKGQQKEKR